MGCEVLTHVADIAPDACAVCGETIPSLAASIGGPARPGERIGVIRTGCVPASAYRVGAKDSNPMCQAAGESAGGEVKR